MSAAKVTLSPEELRLVTDAGWILTKNRITGKVYELFGQLAEVYREYLNTHYPDELIMMAASPKIAKGEQYLGLPWVMLDYPRHFTRDDVFAVRSFFWWGKGCSITLQLSGSVFEKYRESLFSVLETSNHAGWWIGVGEDPWQHHFDADNMMPLSADALSVGRQKPFLKLSALISLSEWDRLPAFFADRFTAFGKLLADAMHQAPMR
jgi:hypothetical protein